MSSNPVTCDLEARSHLHRLRLRRYVPRSSTGRGLERLLVELSVPRSSTGRELAHLLVELSGPPLSRDLLLQKTCYTISYFTFIVLDPVSPVFALAYAYVTSEASGVTTSPSLYNDPLSRTLQKAVTPVPVL